MYNEKKLNKKTVEQSRVCGGSPTGKEGSVLGRICGIIVCGTGGSEAKKMPYFLTISTWIRNAY